MMLPSGVVDPLVFGSSRKLLLRAVEGCRHTPTRHHAVKIAMSLTALPLKPLGP